MGTSRPLAEQQPSYRVTSTSAIFGPTLKPLQILSLVVPSPIPRRQVDISFRLELGTA